MTIPLKKKLSSIKVIVGGVAAGLLVAGLLFARLYGESQALYSSFVTGIVSLAGLFFSAQVADKKFNAKLDDKDPQA